MSSRFSCGAALGTRTVNKVGHVVSPGNHGERGAGGSKAPMMPGAERRRDADDWVYVITEVNGL